MTGVQTCALPISKYISWFAVCRWSMEGYGTTANLNELPQKIEMGGQLQEIEKEAEDFFTFTAGHMWKAWLLLLAFAVGFGILSRIVLTNIRKSE